MPTSLDYLRGDARIDLKRKERGGKPSIFEGFKYFAVQCSECGRWRAVQTVCLPNYRFVCYNSNCENFNKNKKMRGIHFYNFNYLEMESMKLTTLRVQQLNELLGR